MGAQREQERACLKSRRGPPRSSAARRVRRWRARPARATWPCSRPTRAARSSPRSTASGTARAAADASEAAAAILAERPDDPPEALLKRCHDALRTTRGVVATLAWFDLASGGLTLDGDRQRRGPARARGPPARRLRRLPHAVRRRARLVAAGRARWCGPSSQPGDCVVMATDGVAADFGSSLMPGVPARGAGQARPRLARPRLRRRAGRRRALPAVSSIRPCRDDERPAILAIVNAAAEAYRGVIPADRWREPYMPARRARRRDRRRRRVLGLRGRRRAARDHGHPAGPRRRPDPPRLHGAGAPGPRRRRRAALAPAGGARHAADARRDVGRGGVGDPLLRAARLRAGVGGAEDRAAAGVLDDPGAAGRDVGGARDSPR